MCKVDATLCRVLPHIAFPHVNALLATSRHRVAAHAQAFEVPESYIGLLNATATEHHTPDDLPLLLLPLPEVPVPAAVPTSKAADSETAQLPEPSMHTPNTAPADTTVAAPALNTVAAPLYGHGQAPGMDTLAGCQPHAENVKHDGTGAAGSRASAGQQPGYALLVPCRTAMRGRFPLNGTYFQVNEMFLDDTSLRCPIQVWPFPSLPGTAAQHAGHPQTWRKPCTRHI